MEDQYLQNNWDQLTSSLPSIKDDFYRELNQLYNSSNRHYHNLEHVKALLLLTDKYRDQLISPETLQYTIWYHDAVYNAQKGNNEEKSALLAKDHLTQLGINTEQIETIATIIRATKAHELTEKNSTFDAQFMLDIDLSILARDRETYMEYTRQIRSEYKVYPDLLYKPGRKKVLAHFLDMEHIYKTDLFREQWEEQAKENLAYELSLL